MTSDPLDRVKVFNTSDIKRARKSYACHLCHKPIQIGGRYHRHRIATELDGKWQLTILRSHVECRY
jgi:hypothetical protein